MLFTIARVVVYHRLTSHSNDSQCNNTVAPNSNYFTNNGCNKCDCMYAFQINVLKAKSWRACSDSDSNFGLLIDSDSDSAGPIQNIK